MRGLVGKKPVYGICLGHQLLCRAVGLETYKLPFGHRGANHPVKDLTTGRVEITSQNHGFAVLGPGGARTLDHDEPVRWETDFGAAELTHINLYDRTVEGLALLDVPGATVQYHPEAGPGPHDALLPVRPLHRRDRGRRLMPRRDDIKKILIIGSGPIVIGQAAEFDYSGTQACKVLMEEGYEVVLVNSNPATIMTDPEIATATYVGHSEARVGNADLAQANVATGHYRASAFVDHHPRGTVLHHGEVLKARDPLHKVRRWRVEGHRDLAGMLRPHRQ